MNGEVDIHKSQALCRGPLKGRVRMGCNYDFTMEFDSFPPRDEPYNYKCPVCGNAGQFRRVA